jgi:hypothetical protein
MFVFAALMLACCGGFVFLLSPVSATVGKREAQAKTFGDACTRQILRDFSASKLVELSTPEYKKQFDLADFQKILDGNKKALGGFVSGKGRASISSSEKEGKNAIIRARYENRATFEKGKAKVRLDLVNKNKIWAIELFSIEPN